MKARISGKDLKLMIVIFGMLIVLIEIFSYIGARLIYIMPPNTTQFFGASLAVGVLFSGAVVGLAIFVYVFLEEGWEHPKLYVRFYTTICVCWFPISAFLSWFEVLQIEFFGEYAILVVPPLMPLWYWCYKGCKKEEE
jgi:hypothetical protein